MKGYELVAICAANQKNYLGDLVTFFLQIASIVEIISTVFTSRGQCAELM